MLRLRGSTLVDIKQVLEEYAKNIASSTTVSSSDDEQTTEEKFQAHVAGLISALASE